MAIKEGRNSGTVSTTYIRIAHRPAKAIRTVKGLIRAEVSVVHFRVRPITEPRWIADVRVSVIQPAAHGVDPVNSDTWYEPRIHNRAIRNITRPCG